LAVGNNISKVKLKRLYVVYRGLATTNVDLFLIQPKSESTTTHARLEGHLELHGSGHITGKAREGRV
jgi:hypothetical protein